MVRFETKLNAESVKQLNKHSLFRLGWVMVVCSLLMIGLGLVGFFAGEDSADRASAIVLIVFGALFVPLVLLVTFILQKVINKSAKYITDETDEVYVFDEEKLYIKQSSKNMQSEATYGYDYLYKVMESATHYFLYISKTQCHIIPKNSATEGNLTELSELLRQKLGKRHIVKRF